MIPTQDNFPTDRTGPECLFCIISWSPRSETKVSGNRHLNKRLNLKPSLHEQFYFKILSFKYFDSEDYSQFSTADTKKIASFLYVILIKIYDAHESTKIF